jgi:outer membrane protein insertion porin family
LTRSFDFVDREGDKYLNFKASAGWSESTLNKGVLATRGHSQSLVLETTVPGSDLSFFKLDYRGQLFQPLSETTPCACIPNWVMATVTVRPMACRSMKTTMLVVSTRFVASRTAPLGPRSTPSRGQAVTGNAGTLADPDQDPLPFGGNV